MRAYPEALAGHEGTVLIWRDGTRMQADDGRPDKSPEEALHNGSVLDQLREPYTSGPFTPDFAPDNDAGRVRNNAFFEKMYGDCHRNEVAPDLVQIIWLPKTWGHSISVNSTNGIAARLEAASREIDELPPDIKRHAYPIGGTFACRTIADTHEPSVHGYGAAIDLNVGLSDYWLWQRSGKSAPRYVNRMPTEIVSILEKHGFIWGGKWIHFDTMHFEYRPELLPVVPD